MQQIHMFTQYVQFLFKESGVYGVTLSDIVTAIYNQINLLSFNPLALELDI